MINIASPNTSRSIQFFEPLIPLSIDAQRIRHVLKQVQEYSDALVLRQLRTHRPEALSIATQALLDALVTPRSVEMCERNLRRFNQSLEASCEEDGDVPFDPMFEQCELMLKRLLEWRITVDGSFTFVTKNGNLKPMDIGIDIPRDDLYEFIRIVEKQNDGEISFDKLGMIAS